MSRFCVCKVIGDGLSPETAFRPAIDDVIDPVTGFRAFNTSVTLAVDPKTGQPLNDWCLVHAAGNFKLVADNADIDLLPDVALDVKVSEMPTKLEMGSKLQAREIDTAFISNADGFRDVIRDLGKLHDANFDEKNFDVIE